MEDVRPEKIVIKTQETEVDAITLESWREQLPKSYSKKISAETVETVNRLIEDPTYGEEFRDNLLSYSHILNSKNSWTIGRYIRALKYTSLRTSGMAQNKAYLCVFPERRWRKDGTVKGMEFIRGEVSTYDKGPLVNKIREQAMIPVHLLHQETFNAAINKTTELMVSAKSEAIQQKAAETLIRELRPPEDSKIELSIGLNDDARDAQRKQSAQLTEIAMNQQKLFKAGLGIEEVQKLHIEHKYVDAETEA